MVVAVDQRDIERLFRKRLGRRKSAEAATDNDDAGMRLRSRLAHDPLHAAQGYSQGHPEQGSISYVLHTQ